MENLLDKEALKYFNQDVITKAGIQVLFNSSEDFKKLFLTKKNLLEQNPENIVLHNSINYFLSNLSKHNLKKEVTIKRDEVFKKIHTTEREVGKAGSKKIKPGSKVFVHSLNNQIIKILLNALRYKQFHINFVMHSPIYYGHSLFQKLRKHTKDLNIYPDISIKEGVEASNLCLIGGDAITKNGDAIVKTGSNLISGVANENNIPVYVCAHSLKYDNNNQTDTLLEIKHKNHNVFEHLHKNKINSYIIEHGIFKPEHVVGEIRFFNKWV